MTKKLDITGNRYWRLTVKSFSHTDKFRSSYWNCDCECGNTVVVRIAELTRGGTKSCGCWQSDTITRINTRHGMSKMPEYKVWTQMRQRCSNPKNKNFFHYGGRGISVCKRWDDFSLFISDMGSRPSIIHSIERVNNSGNYEPSNCRWATMKEQCRNKRNAARKGSE
jgi:hypothetical protein